MLCRCPSLRPLGLRVWQHAVPALHALASSSALVPHLQLQEGMGGPGAACAYLLGNVAQVSAVGLKVQRLPCQEPCRLLHASKLTSSHARMQRAPLGIVLCCLLSVKHAAAITQCVATLRLSGWPAEHSIGP